MGRLLHRIGALLPKWLDGQELIQQCREIEQRCWRELGYEKPLIFDGDVPAFLMLDGAGHSCDLSAPTEPVTLTARMANLLPSALPLRSTIGTNLDTLARLLNLTPFESQWLLWSYCVWRFGRAILPVIPMHDTTYGCEVLALLCEMPVDAVRDAVASRWLHTWGFLDGDDADGAMPYDSDKDLSIALCQAHVSLPASR
jgi:hypothetical protein